LPERQGYIYTNAQLVGAALGAKRTEFADSERTDIELHPKIKDYIYDNLPSAVVDKVLHQKDSYELTLYNNIVTFADGGIHSTYDLKIPKKIPQALYVESNDEWILMNVDASSYYPAIMIQLDSLSRSIKNKQLFVDVFNDRVAIKHKKNKTKDDDDRQLAYKLILNTTYGAGGCEFLDLCDKYHRSKCCRYGQLLLTALANKLYKNVSGLSVIQTNTDGVLIYCRRKDVDAVLKYKDEWSQITGIGMDVDNVEKIWQRDVNNYLMIKEGGKIIEIASSAGFMPQPSFAVYAATKSYVISFSRGLRHELLKKKIGVTAVCPGPVDTEFNDVAKVKFALKGLTSEYVAKYAIKKMFKRKLVIVPGKVMKCARFLAKITPEKLLLKVSYNQQKKKG
jgi:NAD(P)-dependent dehydrogenase (short-subunit alcohol dehydrogenase family)